MAGDLALNEEVDETEFCVPNGAKVVGAALLMAVELGGNCGAPNAEVSLAWLPASDAKGDGELDEVPKGFCPEDLPNDGTPNAEPPEEGCECVFEVPKAEPKVAPLFFGFDPNGVTDVFAPSPEAPAARPNELGFPAPVCKDANGDGFALDCCAMLPKGKVEVLEDAEDPKDDGFDGLPNAVWLLLTSFENGFPNGLAPKLVFPNTPVVADPLPNFGAPNTLPVLDTFPNPTPVLELLPKLGWPNTPPVDGGAPVTPNDGFPKALLPNAAPFAMGV